MKYEDLLRPKNLLTVPDRTVTASHSYGNISIDDYGFPILFSERLAKELSYQMEKAYRLGFPYDFKFKLPLENNPTVNGEAYRFMLALKSYYDSDCPLLTWPIIQDLIKDGYLGIERLKKLRSYHTVISTGGFFLDEEPDPWVKKISSKLDKVRDIGQIFNVRYWFFWDQPDEHDWKYCFEPLNKIAETDLQLLEETVYGLLPDEVETIEEEEILLSTSGSSSREKNGKTSKLFLTKQKENHFSNEPLEGYGSFIQKCPGDTRFSITLSAPHSNSVKLIERQVSLIASEVAFSCYVKDDEEYMERYTKFAEANDYFFCRDLKKDGLTKPRPLLQAVCRAIKRKYPHLPACRYFGIYDDFFIHIDGVKKNPPRGVGLGMSSALTTILQSALLVLTRIEMLEEVDAFGDVQALIYHDDIAIGSSDEHTLVEFEEYETGIFKRFGLIKNRRKSFMGTKWFVLCENYSDDELNAKDHYQRYLLELPYASVNISHAKFQFGSNLRFIDTVDWKPYLEGLIAHWGYEYFSDEAVSPYQLGGWVPAYYMNVDIALVLKPPTRKEKAAGLCHTMEKPNAFKALKKYDDKYYLSPVEQLFGHSLEMAGEDKTYNYGMTQRDVARQFLKLDKPGSKKGYWQFVLKERVTKFNQLMQLPDPPIDKWYKMYHSHWSANDIIPPRELLVKLPVEGYEEGEPYRPENPYLQFLKYHNPDKIRKSVIPWPTPPGMTWNHRLQLSAAERLSVQYSSTLLTRYDFGELGLMNVVPRLIPSENYFNPNQVRAACVAVFSEDFLPKNETRKSLLFNSSLDFPLFTRLSNHVDKKLISILASKIGFTETRKVVEDLTLFAREVLPKLQQRKALEEMAKVLLQVEERISDSEPLGSQLGSSNFTDKVRSVHSEALSDSGYFKWEQDGCPIHKDWRYKYFESINDKINNIDIIYMDYVPRPDEPEPTIPDDLHFDDVEQFLWKRSGGQLDGDLPVLRNLIGLDDENYHEDEERDWLMESDPGGSDSDGEYNIWG